MRCFIIIVLLKSATCRLAISRNYAIPPKQPPADEPPWALPQGEKIRIRPRAKAIQPPQAIPAATEYVQSSDPAMAIPSAADSVPTFKEDNATIHLPNADVTHLLRAVLSAAESFPSNGEDKPEESVPSFNEGNATNHRPQADAVHLLWNVLFESESGSPTN